jgi:propanol-preferring alcohol dehydrogenase
VYASLVFSPRVAGMELGMKLLKRGSVLVNVGMPPASDGDFAIAPLELLRKDALIASSAVGTVEEMRELVDLAAAQKVKTHVARVGRLADVPQIFEDMEAGRYTGRAVLELR